LVNGFNIFFAWTECWAITNQYESKLSIVVMRMLRWMCLLRLEMIELEMKIVEIVGVVHTAEKTIQTRIRWFGHVKRRHVDYEGI